MQTSGIAFTDREDEAIKLTDTHGRRRDERCESDEMNTTTETNKAVPLPIKCDDQLAYCTPYASVCNAHWQWTTARPGAAFLICD